MRLQEHCCLQLHQSIVVAFVYTHAHTHINTGGSASQTLKARHTGIAFGQASTPPDLTWPGLQQTRPKPVYVKFWEFS